MRIPTEESIVLGQFDPAGFFGVRTRPVKYYCCDCKAKLNARAKTPKWRAIPSDQKRCRRCSVKHRGLLKKQQIIS